MENSSSAGPRNSVHEYDAIRSELVLRIENVNSQSNAAIIAIISTWTIGFALFILLKEERIESVIPLLMCAFVFLVPVFYFILLAVKSGENI